MLELIKLGDKTYCIKSPVNVGVYKLDEENVCIIDTGNSKDFGKIIDKILTENHWNLKYIINTHSHADHIGGNQYLQNKYNCRIFSSKIESYFIKEPLLEPAMLYSANPPTEMLSHFLKADESFCEEIENFKIEGLNFINLSGHSLGQIGVITSDGVCFCGDSYTSKKILNKYAIQYVYDINVYLQTLEMLKTTDYKYYVPSHGEIEKSCKNTININIENIVNIENTIMNIICDEVSYNDFLSKIFEIYHIKLNITQYHLISATLKSFLTKLESDKKIKFIYKDNELIIKSV